MSVGGGVGEETEVATADFTWVLYVPRGEVGLPAPPSDKGTEGREEEEKEEGVGVEEEEEGGRKSPVQQLPSLTCAPAPCGDTRRPTDAVLLRINTRSRAGTTHSHTSPNSNVNTLHPPPHALSVSQMGPRRFLSRRRTLTDRFENQHFRFFVLSFALHDHAV